MLECAACRAVCGSQSVKCACGAVFCTPRVTGGCEALHVCPLVRPQVEAVFPDPPKPRENMWVKFAGGGK